MVFSFIFLGVFVYLTIDWVYLFLSYTWWPYHKWISSNVVDIEEVEISSAIEGEKLQAVLIRPKNMDKTQKHVGVLFHHGYTGKKEKVFRFAFPLAMAGCVVLCPDARGHGESKNKAFNMNDFKGIMEDCYDKIVFYPYSHRHRLVHILQAGRRLNPRLSAQYPSVLKPISSYPFPKVPFPDKALLTIPPRFR